ncbi:MAG: hemolysin family protein [Erythrobacter sp.]
MTPFPWTDLLIIAGLIVLNGVFAMSELAIVSARTARLRAAAQAGNGGAKAALALAAEPGKFLSTVQIGITLIGIIAGAYSGASLGGPVAERLAAWGFPIEWAEEAGFAAVIALTTFLSLVVGELVPKQVALRAAVPIATAMARPMAMLARVAAPLVWLLDASSGLLIRLLGVRPAGQSSVTAEELHMLFAEATRSGVIEHEQHQMLQGVVRLAQRPVREMMTPRTEIDWIDLAADEEAIRATIESSPHSLLPVAEGSPDKVVGVVKVREILTRLVTGEPVDLAILMKKAEVVPDQLDAVDALRVLQQSEIAMAMVHDEYGHLDGIVTPVDLLTALVGDFVSDQEHGDGPGMVEREDGSLLVSGSLSADVLADRLDIEYGDDREFGTAAGYALHVLKRLPVEGEHFTDQGYRFEIVDMDGRRIDKLLVAREDGAPIVSGSDDQENGAAGED